MDCNRGFMMERDITTGEIKPFFIKVRASDIVNDDGTPYTGGGGGAVTPPPQPPQPQPGGGGTMKGSDIIKAINGEGYELTKSEHIIDGNYKLQCVSYHSTNSKITKKMIYGTIPIIDGINGDLQANQWTDMFMNTYSTSYIELLFPPGMLSQFNHLNGTTSGVSTYSDISFTFDCSELLNMGKYTIDNYNTQRIGAVLSRMNSYHMIIPEVEKVYLYTYMSESGKSGEWNPAGRIGDIADKIKPAVKILIVGEVHS